MATSLAAAALAAPVVAESPAFSQAAGLIARSEAANAALMRGDAERWQALSPLTDDFVLMSPFGGMPSKGRYTQERLQAIGRFFRNGRFEQEVVQTFTSEDMVVLALIGGLPAQPWALRVTLVYRRDGDHWRLAHRHADPLAEGITLEQAARLGRGEGVNP